MRSEQFYPRWQKQLKNTEWQIAKLIQFRWPDKGLVQTRYTGAHNWFSRVSWSSLGLCCLLWQQGETGGRYLLCYCCFVCTGISCPRFTALSPQRFALQVHPHKVTFCFGVEGYCVRDRFCCLFYRYTN